MKTVKPELIKSWHDAQAALAAVNKMVVAKEIALRDAEEMLVASVWPADGTSGEVFMFPMEDDKFLSIAKYASGVAIRIRG